MLKKRQGARQIEIRLLPGAHLLECGRSVSSERDSIVEKIKQGDGSCYAILHSNEKELLLPVLIWKISWIWYEMNKSQTQERLYCEVPFI